MTTMSKNTRAFRDDSKLVGKNSFNAVNGNESRTNRKKEAEVELRGRNFHCENYLRNNILSIYLFEFVCTPFMHKLTLHYLKLVNSTCSTNEKINHVPCDPRNWYCLL